MEQQQLKGIEEILKGIEEIILFRHASTENNMQGEPNQNKDPSLTIQGYGEVLNMRAYLKGYFSTKKMPNNIYTPPIKRVIQTAELLIENDPKRKLVIIEELRDQDISNFMGSTTKEISERKRRGEQPKESWNELYKRVNGCLEYIANRHMNEEEEKTTLVIGSHKYPLLTILSNLLYPTSKEEKNIEYLKKDIPPGTILSLNRDGWGKPFKLIEICHASKKYSPNERGIITNFV